MAEGPGVAEAVGVAVGVGVGAPIVQVMTSLGRSSIAEYLELR